MGTKTPGSMWKRLKIRALAATTDEDAQVISLDFEWRRGQGARGPVTLEEGVHQTLASIAADWHLAL